MQVGVDILKDLIALVQSQFTDDLTVVPSDEGWNIYCIDPSHTSMMTIDILAEAFTPYEKWDPFCVSAGKLSSALKNFSSTVDIIVSGGRCTLEGDGMKSKIPTLVYEESTRRVPELESDATAEVTVDDLKRAIKAAPEDVAQIAVEIRTDCVSFIAENEEGYGNVMKLEGDKVLTEGEAKSYYPLALLTKSVNAIPKGTLLTLSLSTDYPMETSWVCNGWKARHLVAPWINSDE